MKNRQWLLKQRPEGAVTPDCFDYVEAPRAPPPGDGRGVLVRHELLLCAPTIRNWISGNRDSFHPVVELGQPVLAPGVSRIVESDDPRWPIGSRVFGASSWQDEQWIDPEAGDYLPIADSMTSVDALGVYGINALTAYFGVLRVGQPAPGEVLLISGAAGSVGSAVAQIGRIKGCRVIGICSGGEKGRWLIEDCGIDAVIDYSQGEVAAQIDALCPDGIDIFFDNIGGPLLAEAIARMRPFGRVVLCGQIATYEDAATTPPLDMMRLIYGGIRIHGFLARHYRGEYAEALGELEGWNRDGLLAHREDVRDGFAMLPRTFADLFSGANSGTLIARIADPDGKPI